MPVTFNKRDEMAAFPEIEKIQYEGPESKNPLAFHWYDENEVVEGKTMKEHLRFSVVYWHTFRGTGSDPFGAGTMVRPWEDGSDSVENACNRARVAFEFMEEAGSTVLRFPRSRCGSRRRHLGRVARQLRRGRQSPQGGTRANRH